MVPAIPAEIEIDGELDSKLGLLRIDRKWAAQFLSEARVDQGEKKISEELADALKRLDEDEEIDVLIYIKRPATSLEEYFQVKKKKGELRFNFLQLADCYVVEASKRLLLEIAENEDVSRLDINPRFALQ